MHGGIASLFILRDFFVPRLDFFHFPCYFLMFPSVNVWDVHFIIT